MFKKRKEEETQEEYLENTKLLLSKVNLDVDSTMKGVDDFIDIIKNQSIDKCYLISTLLNKYISYVGKYNKKDIGWFDYVANRCLVIKIYEDFNKEVRH